MAEKIYKFINRKNRENSAWFNLFKFFYLISYEYVKAILDVILALFLSHFWTTKNWTWFVVILLLIVLENVWFWLVNSYKECKRKTDKNNKLISSELTAMITTLDNYILDNGKIGVFEYASDLVSSSLYNTLQKIINCNVRVSVIQQFIENNKKNCVMLSRQSKSRQNCSKKQKEVKYGNKKKKDNYFYLKILQDNRDNLIICNLKEIESIFYYKHNDRKSDMKQYLGIPVKMQANHIIFLLQLDADKEDAFGKNEKEIYDFYNNYIHPYICFLEHAYNIEKY